MYQLIKCGMAVLCVLGAAGSAATAAQKVSASWSQISGQSAPHEGEEAAPLNVRMRFALSDPGDLTCEDFTTRVRGEVMPVTKWQTRTARNYRDLLVCDAPMGEDWPEATLVTPDGTPVDVDVRGADGTITARPVMFPGPAAVGRRQLALGKGDRVEIAVFGETGCHGKFAPRNKQDCEAGDQWLFPRLISDAQRAGNLPDLAIHLGNMRFERAGDHKWKHWEAEFFGPAQSLLLSVPWAFARGPQETCSPQKAGIGWVLFFGSETEGAVQPDGCNSPGIRLMPRYFDIQVRSTLKPGAPHRIALVDSAPHPDAELSQNFRSVLEWANMGWGAEHPPSAWIVTNRPVWGLDTFGGPMQQQNDPAVLSAFERGLKALPDGQCKPYSAGTCGLKAVVSGHQAAFQNIVFPGGGDGASQAHLLPQQFVVGNSGVKLRPSEPNEVFAFENGGMLARRSDMACGHVANWFSDHGYGVWNLGVAHESDEPSGLSGSVRLLRSDEGSAEIVSLPLAGKSGTLDASRKC